MNESKKKGVALFPITAAVVILIFSGSIVFTVDQSEYAVITQFGRVVRAITEPGLNWKWPIPVQNLQRFDNRLKIYSPAVSEFLTRDKKNILVESFVSYRIKDPELYMKTLNTAERTQQRMNDIVFSELGVALGNYDLDMLINVIPDQIKLNDMMEQVKNAASTKLDDYGILLSDLRVKMLNFPEKNQQSVFQRMRAEREKIARLYRSEGTEEASKIRAIADKEKVILLSQAYEKAEQIRGEGDARAIKIYAEAFRQDPRFYDFVRSLQAYEKILDGKTTIVIPADSELFKYLEQPKKQ
ncbi:protease modulator HflC [Treponema zuelzerae]|uniref:Protein HflC n=1 Tax=Teretinema zuelzerae TaxID=156 RepID=A0AAE3EF44_9SPIR|nr:protease modulator HflC [Teretinema zuelzerae]MCD1653585.1 protease modulator HflC [Teretinema zuelzerae]